MEDELGKEGNDVSWQWRMGGTMCLGLHNVHIWQSQVQKAKKPALRAPLACAMCIDTLAHDTAQDIISYTCILLVNIHSGGLRKHAST